MSPRQPPATLSLNSLDLGLRRHSRGRLPSVVIEMVIPSTLWWLVAGGWEGVRRHGLDLATMLIVFWQVRLHLSTPGIPTLLWYFLFFMASLWIGLWQVHYFTYSASLDDFIFISVGFLLVLLLLYCSVCEIYVGWRTAAFEFLVFSRYGARDMLLFVLIGN